MIKLSYFTLVIFLVGCQSAGFESGYYSSNPIIALFGVISEQREINKLPPAERCERIHVDLREDCRQKVKKEFEELCEAINKKKNN